MIQTLIVSLLLKLAQESNHGTSVSLDPELRENNGEHKVDSLMGGKFNFFEKFRRGQTFIVIY